jgi:hypothetical protein
MCTLQADKPTESSCPIAIPEILKHHLEVSRFTLNSWNRFVVSRSRSTRPPRRHPLPDGGSHAPVAVVVLEQHGAPRLVQAKLENDESVS